MKHYIRKIKDYAIAGGIGSLVLLAMTGCDTKSNDSDNVLETKLNNNVFLVIDEVSNGVYKIAEEYPSTKTTVVLRELNGKERILTPEEITMILKEEEKKIDNNTSSLTNHQMNNNTPSLGAVLLSSAAGTIFGAWIGSKLFSNPNYEQQKQNSYKSNQVYSKSVSSFGKRDRESGGSSFVGGGAGASTKNSSTTKSTGFFSNSSSSSSSKGGSSSSGG